MDKNGNQKWREMLVLVENPNYVPGLNEELIPAAFVAVAGEKTPTKLHLVNRMLVDWQVCFKKTRVTKKDKCPFYQVSTQNNHLRTFFGVMKRQYNWKWSDSDFKSFPGSLAGILGHLYDKRRKKWVSFFV